MDNQIIKFGVVGFGHIGKRHAEMINRNPEAKLVAVCDVRPAEDLGYDFTDGTKLYTDLNALLAAHPDIEVVCLCTPNGLHSDQAMQAINAGRHIVVEKPMGLSKAKCEQVIHHALRNNKQVFCVMQNRYSPPSVWLKDLISRKVLGDIFMVQVNCYWNRDDRYYKKGGWKGVEELDGGTLFTQFSHFLDIMYWLFGDIKDIQGRFADFTHSHSTDFEDSGMLNFAFTEGGFGSLNYSTAIANQNLESSMTIIGEKGSIKIGGQYMNEVELCNIEGYTMPELPEANPANDYGAYKGSAANHNYIFQNVVDTLKGRCSITTNALEGLKVVEMIERIYEIRDASFKKVRK